MSDRWMDPSQEAARNAEAPKGSGGQDPGRQRLQGRDPGLNPRLDPRFDGGQEREYADLEASADQRRAAGREAYGRGVTAMDLDAGFGGRDEALEASDRSWIDTCADDEVSGRSHHRGRGPKGWSRDDRRIYEDVCERLLHDRLIDARGIEVEVENGVVMLRGEARAAADPALAERLARETPGVTGVEVDLVVRPRPHPPEPEPDPEERIDKSPLGYPILPT